MFPRRNFGSVFSTNKTMAKLTTNYDKLVESGEIKMDQNQYVAIQWLNDYIDDVIYNQKRDLKKYKFDYLQLPDNEKKLGSKSQTKLNYQYQQLEDIKSLYLWGDPGCGKSFIIEELFKSLEM